MSQSFIAAVAAGLMVAATAQADLFTFDPDGAGAIAPVEVGSFDFLPGNALADFPSQQPFSSYDAGDTGLFTFYQQARLGSLIGPNGEDIALPGLNSAFEITAVSEYTVGFSISADGSQIALFNPAGRTNFTRLIFDDTPDADDLTGAGFFDGAVILEGTNTFASGIIQTLPFPPTDLDQFGPDNYPLTDTMVSFGGALTAANAFTTLDPAFFLDTLVAMNVNTNLASPFAQVNPSAVFDDGAVTPVLGSVNGLGEDVQLQTDANASFLIPEPASVALLTLGGLMIVARRRTA